jgi:rubredoxin
MNAGTPPSEKSNPSPEFYCPACGDRFVDPGVPPILISPGSFKWTCPVCDTAFRVRIEFDTLAEPPAG